MTGIRARSGYAAKATRPGALAAAVVLALCLPSSAAAIAVTEFPTASAAAGPTRIANGPDGALWFTESSDRIGHVTPNGVVTEFQTGVTGGSSPDGMAAGPDGNLWFTENSRAAIGRITPAGVVSEFSTTTTGSGPADITAGPDGDLWFAEHATGKIGRMTPAGTMVNEYPATAGSNPYGITAGPDGNLWFTEDSPGKVGRITPAGTVTEYSPPTANSGPKGIVAGPDGNLWFAEFNAGKIGKITPAGTVTESPPTSGHPEEITLGPDGNLWFSEPAAHTIGRITPAGTITEFPLDTSSIPKGIMAGPDGDLWFADSSASEIGRFATDVPPPASGNLLRNPGFEEGTPVASDAATGALTGWATIPNFTGVAYGSAGGFPDTTVGGQLGGGSAFAAGGPVNAQSEAIQQVDVSDQTQPIDAGRTTATVSGLLGGSATDADAATVTATFLTAAETPLGSVTIGPVAPADRESQTTLLPRSNAAAVPAGTRAIRVVAGSTRHNGLYNDGYFDNLSLTLAIAPGPGPGPAPTSPPAPVLSALSLSPRSFRAASSGATAAARKKRRTGTRIAFTDSLAGTVTFTVLRRGKGRRLHGRCVKPSRKTRHKKRCTLLSARGHFSRPTRTGRNAFHFSGRIHNRKLRPGTYTLRATPSAAGTAGSPVKRTFKIKR